MNQTLSTFNRLAESYDQTFTHTRLGRLLRSRVWEQLEHHFSPGQRILDLACGTGEDAVWLLRHGFNVTAADGAEKMLALASDKANRSGFPLNTIQITLQSVIAGDLAEGPFDGILCDFGGLNTLPDRCLMGKALHSLATPNGKLVVVVMGPLCPWEILGHLIRGRPKAAFRRFQSPTAMNTRGIPTPVWYPSPARLRNELAPQFLHLRTESLGFFLPPTDFSALVEHWPRCFTFLDRLDRLTAGSTFGWGDHFLSVFQRC